MAQVMNTEDTNDNGEYPQFTWSETSTDRVMIYWCGKQVTVIKGKRATKLMDKLSESSIEQQQLLLAKITGNFKRGNERQEPGQ